MNIYQEQLMDHYKNPRNRGLLENYDFATADYNPSCGDRISMTGIIVNNTLTAVQFIGEGCVISQAAASLITQAIIDKKIEIIETLDHAWVQTVIAMPIGPLRIKCALLSLEVIKQGIRHYKQTR